MGSPERCHRRAASVAVFVVLVCGGCTSSANESAVAEAREPVAGATSTSDRFAPIPEDRLVIAPEGPYVDGQEVTLLASDSVRIDLHNSSPRICAKVDDGAEVCDPHWIVPNPLADTPPSTQGITIELPRRHFGPEGDNDCGAEAVECRLLWQTEAGELLASAPLGYTDTLEPRPLVLESTTVGEAGTISLRVGGLDATASTIDLLTSRELQTIEDAIERVGPFDVEGLEVAWEVLAFCGFGPGGPPIGSDSLVDPPSWWSRLPFEGPVEPSVASSFHGGICDWRGIAGPRQISSDGNVVLGLRRNIYGYGGWVDCATATCYVEVALRWTHPMADGSSLGGETAFTRALVDVPETWPSVRPSIAIAEPGPYEPGQTVTVEVRDNVREENGLAVAWCPGGENPCGYMASTFADGVHRVTWTLPGSGSGCGADRCYFAIESHGEGLAPPAILIVPLAE